MSRTRIVMCLVVGVVALASLAFTETPLAEVSYFGSGLEFSPKTWGHGFILRIVAPDGFVVDKTVKDGAPSFDLSELKGPLVDGLYKYELRLIVSPSHGRRDAAHPVKAATRQRIRVPSLSGSFQVVEGSIVSPVSAKSDEPSVDLSMPQGSPDTPDYTFNENLHVMGLVGIGTTSPGWDLHILSGDIPSMRLQQDTSGGYPAQTWEIAGHEYGLWIDDVTHGRTPLWLGADGRVGFGTWAPGYAVEVERTGVNSAVVVDRTDGATNYINATASYGNFGTVTNHPLRLVVNSAWQMRINGSSAIQMANGAYLSAGGVWTNASSRALKKDIQSLSIEKATAALADLDPVEFAYKSNGERHAGFIAEDVPDLVASADRSGLSPMDVVAVLTRIVKEQQEINNELRARISALESR